MQNTVVTVLGRKGSGKSVLGRQIAEGYDRLVALDTVGEFDAVRDRVTIVQGRDACLAALGQLGEQRRFRLALRCDEVDELLDCLLVVRELDTLLVYIEETSFYCSPSQLPPALSWLVRYGRHRKIDQLYIARRPSELHRDLTAQSDLVVTFRQREPIDLRYLNACGFDETEVATLPQFAIAVPVDADLSRAPAAVIERLPARRLDRVPADVPASTPVELDAEPVGEELDQPGGAEGEGVPA